MPADSNSKTHDGVETWSIQAEPPEDVIQKAKEKKRSEDSNSSLDEFILDYVEKIEFDY